MAEKTERKETPNLVTKLSRIQVAIKAPKDQYNQFGKYGYRTAEDILEALKPHLEENRVAILLTDTPFEIGGRFYIKAKATLLDCDSDATISTEAFAREPEQRAGFDPSQISGSSSSYARKICLCGILAVDGEKDADVTNSKIGQDRNSDRSRGRQQTGTRDTGTQESRQPQRQSQQPARQTQVPQDAKERQPEQVRPVQTAGSRPEEKQKTAGNPADRKVLDEIITILNRYPQSKLMKQIRERYSINRIDELSAQDAVQCLACLRSYDEKKSKDPATEKTKSA